MCAGGLSHLPEPPAAGSQQELKNLNLNSLPMGRRWLEEGKEHLHQSPAQAALPAWKNKTKEWQGVDLSQWKTPDLQQLQTPAQPPMCLSAQLLTTHCHVGANSCHSPGSTAGGSCFPLSKQLLSRQKEARMTRTSRRPPAWGSVLALLSSTWLCWELGGDLLPQLTLNKLGS